MKNTGRIILIAIILLLVIFGVGSCGRYNNMVQLRNEVDTKWGQVENDYQTRADKIGQLINVVKGQANFEQATLSEVVNARAAAMQSITNVNAANLTQENLDQFAAAQDNLTRAYNGAKVVFENYPQLGTNASFRDLGREISEIENRINRSRMDFNNTVRDYNNAIQTFPGNIYAGMFGFHPRPLFHATAGAEKAPDIQFPDFRHDNKPAPGGSPAPSTEPTPGGGR